MVMSNSQWNQNFGGTTKRMHQWTVEMISILVCMIFIFGGLWFVSGLVAECGYTSDKSRPVPAGVYSDRVAYRTRELTEDEKTRWQFWLTVPVGIFLSFACWGQIKS